jgi:hypothetical protein
MGSPMNFTNDAYPDRPAPVPGSGPSDALPADADFQLVRGPGRERQVKSMPVDHTERFVVAPHRGAWGSGIWSVRRDGELLAVHPSQWEAMLDATDRAYAEWSEHGVRSLVQAEEMDGRLVEARVFGPRRADPRSASRASCAAPAQSIACARSSDGRW